MSEDRLIMKKLLWISSSVPYDSVAHAGGKIHNFYLKKLHQQNLFDIKLLSFCAPREIPKLDLDKYGIEHELVYWRRSGVKRFIWGAIIRITENNPFNRYANFTNGFIEWGVLTKLRKFKREGYKPDIIILQWTQVVLLIAKVKKMYPDAKIVAIEEDVSFLSYERKMKAATGFVNRLLWKRKYKKLKKIEIESLKLADLVINNNYKDQRLLESTAAGVNTWVWCPYFQSMLDVQYQRENYDILFYGAMEREENWKSAIWFIENVFNKLDEKYSFVVIGNRPNPILKKYESERIHILGFVEDIKPYFEKSLCLVAPLVLGAGVKIKILEGLSSGIPVLTNKIGIEGIPANDQREYYFCETAEDYINAIKRLENKDTSIAMSESAKKFIAENYNYDRDALELGKKLSALL